MPILVGDPGMIQTCDLETWRPFFEVNDVKVRRVANVLHREVTAKPQLPNFLDNDGPLRARSR